MYCLVTMGIATRVDCSTVDTVTIQTLACHGLLQHCTPPDAMDCTLSQTGGVFCDASLQHGECAHPLQKQLQRYKTP